MGLWSLQFPRNQPFSSLSVAASRASIFGSLASVDAAIGSATSRDKKSGAAISQESGLRTDKEI
jgi:hypothetical protein